MDTTNNENTKNLSTNATNMSTYTNNNINIDIPKDINA